MNGGLVPSMLLSVTLALMLAFAPTRAAVIGLVVFAAAAVLAFVVALGLSATVIFVGLWLSIIAIAIIVYLPAARWLPAVVPLCINAGLWMGAHVGLSNDRRGLALSLLPALISFPAKLLVERKFDIIIKVVASWMIAIASLSMFVSLMPTPGYKPDHME